ncbi:MAG: hypothetical protein IPI66_12850 [Chitinophagaceae bacterium]|nr:hypothetical protein [Chitinophagaceae bacterium]
MNRTWNVRPSATPSSTDILFEYSAGEGNAGFNCGNPLNWASIPLRYGT